MTRHSIMKRLTSLLTVLGALVLGTGAACAYTYTATWYTPATQFGPAQGPGYSCTFGTRSSGSHTYRYAGCAVDEAFTFRTAAAPMGSPTNAASVYVTEGIGAMGDAANGIEIFLASESPTDVTHPICFKALGRLDKANYTEYAFWELPDPEVWYGGTIPTGQWDTLTATIGPVSAGAASQYYFLSGDKTVKCDHSAGTDCGSQDGFSYYITRVLTPYCCTGAGAPWACCTGFQTGASCGEVATDVDVLGIRTTYLAPIE